MKTLIIAFSVMFFLTINSSAGNNNNKPWDFFGVVFMPGVPSSSDDTNVGGIRIGLPVSGGKGRVCGIEVGAACCYQSEDVTGVQTAPLFCVAKTIIGLQASPVNIADKVEGMQFGLVNISKDAKFQLGLLNYIKDGPIPYMIIINFKL